MKFGDLKRSEKNSVDIALDMREGYVLDFSNRTIEYFFEDEFSIEFYSEANGRNGNSKAKRLRTILGALEGPQAAHILRTLWSHRSSISFYSSTEDPSKEQNTHDKYFAVISKLEGGSPQVDLEVFTKFEKTDVLFELIQSIERDIRADKPQAAIDRLHLFCVKRFRHLLSCRNIASFENEPLNSLVGKYKKALVAENKHSEMSLMFIAYSIEVFEKFNDLRNNRSLAHDNELLHLDEARFIFDAVSAVCLTSAPVGQI